MPDLNPVLIKELRGRMRGARAFVLLTIYLLILSGVTLLFYAAIADVSASDLNAGRQIGKGLFLLIATVSLIEVCLITPALTAGGIAGEKERQTYDLLVSSLLSPWQIAWGKLGAALSFALLMILTVGYIPFVLPLLLKGVTVDPAKIAHTLVLLMVLPLAAGLLVKTRYEVAAARVVPFLNKLSTLSFVLMMFSISVTNIRNILRLFGTRGVLASVLLVSIGSAIGWFLGGQEAGARRVMTLGTAQRNISASLVIAEDDLNDPKAVMSWFSVKWRSDVLR